MRKVKWLILAGIFGLTLWFASLYGGNIPYMFLKFVAAVPVVSGLYALWVIFHFKYYQSIGSMTIVKGEPVDYTFCITNEDYFFYDNIRVRFFDDNSRLIGVTGEPQYHLLPDESKEIHTKLCCNYRGEYAVGACTFWVSDYLHLLELPYKVPSLLKVMVLPRITEWKFEREILQDAGGRKPGSSSTCGDMDVQVRNYVAGDSMRQIHWKASARNARLMSREQYENRRQEMAFFFDLSPYRGEESNRLIYEDEMIEQLVAAVNVCRSKRIPCRVIMDTQGVHNYIVDSKEQWQDFYQMCGKLQFQAKRELKEIPVEPKLLSRLKYAVFFTNELESGFLQKVQREFAGIENSIVLIDVGTNIAKKDRTDETVVNGIHIYHTQMEQ